MLKAVVSCSLYSTCRVIDISPNLKMAVFWDTASYSLAEVYGCLRDGTADYWYLEMSSL